MDPLISHELFKLDPSVPFRAKSSYLHHTWAKTFYSRPELYIQPQSIQEIQKAITLARRCRRRLVTVGSAHSPSDLTCTSSWMLNLDDFGRVLSLSRDTGLVVMESGIRLHDLGLELEKHGLALPNLGSIDSQSIAGVISTSTHGSSMRHGLLSQPITALSVTLANGQTVRCSASSNPQLFRAALVSLGALGIITEVTLRAVPAYNIAWQQSLHPLSEILSTWNTELWTRSEFVRVWWMPYMNRAIIWQADKTSSPLRPPAQTFYGGRLGFHVYHNLLALSQYIPRILPWVEWFVFGMQYGFSPGAVVATAIEPGRTGLLMDCLYSQFVNEWALPLEKGPEAITRLSAWLHGDTSTARIPFDPKGLYVHCPVEVRVSDTSPTTTNSAETPRPYLDPTYADGPTLYLNATLYRPYNRDPPCMARYYEAFEWLMRDLGGRPHWAKNFGQQGTGTGRKELQNMYGNDLDEYLKVRNEVDPEGMFLGEWHRRFLLPSYEDNGDSKAFPLEEKEKTRTKIGSAGDGDGVLWIGEKAASPQSAEQKRVIAGGSSEDEGSSPSPSPPMTATSEESFDYLAKGEASVFISS